MWSPKANSTVVATQKQPFYRANAQTIKQKALQMEEKKQRTQVGELLLGHLRVSKKGVFSRRCGES